MAAAYYSRGDGIQPPADLPREEQNRAADLPSAEQSGGINAVLKFEY